MEGVGLRRNLLTYRHYCIPVRRAGGGGVPLNSGAAGEEPSSAEGAVLVESVPGDVEPAHRQSIQRFTLSEFHCQSSVYTGIQRKYVYAAYEGAT